MGDTLYGKSYGLTHEELLKAHHVLTSTATAKKTPYQLDLEVKDRKPDIVPKVGDKVKIKSREWYEKWKDNLGDIVIIGSSCWFYESRKIWCGETLEVSSIDPDGEYRLGGVKGCWILEYFEEVYPQESSKKVECANAFESLGMSARELKESSKAFSLNYGVMYPAQGIGSSYDLGTLSRQGVGIEAWPIPSPRITLPQSCFGSTSAVVHQDFFKKEEPELQTIKKHRFIKLEKL